MGKRYLIDTNILIYVLNGSFNQQQKDWLTEKMRLSFSVSLIIKMELLGWKKHSINSYQEAKLFINAATIYEINQNVVEQTIYLRRNKALKLPDAIIATTCLVNDFDLITRNTQDFKGLKNLNTINPFEI